MSSSCVDMWTYKNIFFNLLSFIYIQHIFNKNTHLKHFKHTIKYNISSLKVLKSSKSSRSTIFSFLMMTKPLSLLLIICTIMNKHVVYFWASNNHELQIIMHNSRLLECELSFRLTSTLEVIFHVLSLNSLMMLRGALLFILIVSIFLLKLSLNIKLKITLRCSPWHGAFEVFDFSCLP